MAVDPKSPFWREWMDKNDKDYWGKFDEKDADQLRAVIKKIYDWIRGQGEDPEDVAKMMVKLGL